MGVTKHYFPSPFTGIIEKNSNWYLLRIKINDISDEKLHKTVVNDEIRRV
ncbi:MAG: hypothetical protein LBO70_03015 [Clostridiales Family XIII bacterium]|nr:hypothetical protein [Clostridiales Family XIII bacterium]